MKAVRNIEAQISKECLAFFHSHYNVLEKKLIDCSGVRIEKPSGYKWILFGNLPQIELAEKCIKDMMSDTIKRNQPLPTNTAQRNSKSSLGSPGPFQKEIIKKALKMPEKKYLGYIAIFPRDKEENVTAMKYSVEDQSLHITGNKSSIQRVETQAEKLIVNKMEISKELHEWMRTEITKLQKKDVAVFFEETEGTVEVWGVSQSSIDSVVKSLNLKREEVKQQLKKRNHAGIINPSAESAQHASKNYRFYPHVKSTYPGHKYFYLKPNFKVSLCKGDILSSNVDSVCCGQDPSLKSNGKIAKSIIKKYKDVRAQISEHVLKKGEHHFGHVFMTDCNPNPPRHIIFVVTVSPYSGKENPKTSLQTIKMCFANVLEFAYQNDIPSMALPLLGTGNFTLSF